MGTSDGRAALVGFRQLGLSFLLGHLADASSGCQHDAMINDSNTNLPLLIYSHGYGGNMDMASYFFRTMASKGMIVAAIEHTDGTASSTVLEDGYERRFNEYFMTGRQQLTRRAPYCTNGRQTFRTGAAISVINQPRMPEINDSFMPYVGSKVLRLPSRGTRVRLFYPAGNSNSTADIIMAPYCTNGASEKSNIQGLLLHDPALGMGYGMLPPNGAKSKIPTISYISDEYNKANVRYGDLTLHVQGCYHGNFVDAPLWAPSLIMRSLSLVIPAMGPADPLRIHDQLAESAIAFMKSLDATSESVMVGDLFERVR